MEVLYVHRNFPAQFGHVAVTLALRHRYQCTMVTETPPGAVGGVWKIRYRAEGGATQRTHFLSRTFENATAHAAGVYVALRPFKGRMRPDLIVGHSGFGSTLFLRELFPETPILSYFEYYYRPHGSDMDFNPKWQPREEEVLRAYARNAMILLDFDNCDAGYSPTQFQRSLMPEDYADKLRVVHDGIDTDFWKRVEIKERRVGQYHIPEDTRIVTYVSRGLESIRGFDTFMRAAKRIYEQHPKVVFLVVGSDEVQYGGDLTRIEEKSFKEHVLKQDDYDLGRILFLGRVPPAALRRILSMSDLHVYLTAPFVLSWSMLNAMACGAVVLGSDTVPVQEVIRHGENGLLTPFFDHEVLAETALDVLRDPASYAELGRAAEKTIAENYSLETILPQMIKMYEDVASGRTPLAAATA